MADQAVTYPHDYRALFSGTDSERPTIVGGQAVNLWAITYLDKGDPSTAATKYGSHDLDVVSSGKALTFLKALPDWHFTPTPMKHFGVGITARLQGVARDGRLLLVEVLRRVAGLEAADLRRVTSVLRTGGGTEKIVVTGTTARLIELAGDVVYANGQLRFPKWKCQVAVEPLKGDD